MSVQEAQPLQDHAVRLHETKPDGMVVHALDNAQFTRNREPARLDGIQVVVQDHVFVPEHVVVSRERRPVGPANPLSQMEGEFPAVFRNLPGVGEIGLHPRVVPGPAKKRIVGQPHPPGPVRHAHVHATPGPAVPADPLHGPHHRRRLRQPLPQWR